MLHVSFKLMNHLPGPHLMFFSCGYYNLEMYPIRVWQDGCARFQTSSPRDLAIKTAQPLLGTECMSSDN